MGEKRYRIIYEDEHLIIIDKPSGMLVIPTPKKETNTLTGLLNEELDARGVEANAYPCHRLDRETSGLVIYAKGKSAQRLMMDKFKNHQIKKTYIAIVQGAVKNSSGVINKKIFNKKKLREETAATGYKVLERKRDSSVLEVDPATGRTNQIRIHLKAIGHPIVGESVYAFRKDFKLKFNRVALHAKVLEFTHPITGQALKFSSPVPEDMERLIKRS